MIIPSYDTFLCHLYNMTLKINNIDDNYNIAVDICKHIDEDYKGLDQKV